MRKPNPYLNLVNLILTLILKPGLNHQKALWSCEDQLHNDGFKPKFVLTTLERHVHTHTHFKKHITRILTKTEKQEHAHLWIWLMNLSQKTTNENTSWCQSAVNQTCLCLSTCSHEGEKKTYGRTCRRIRLQAERRERRCRSTTAERRRPEPQQTPSSSSFLSLLTPFLLLRLLHHLCFCPWVVEIFLQQSRLSSVLFLLWLSCGFTAEVQAAAL